MVAAVAVSSCETWDHENWVAHPEVKDIKQDFRSFGGPLQKVIEKMGNTDIWALFDHMPARTFVKGKVSMVRITVFIPIWPDSANVPSFLVWRCCSRDYSSSRLRRRVRY